MTRSVASPTVTELLASFAEATPDHVERGYRRLVEAVWNGGEPTASALPAVPHLVAFLDRVDDLRRGHLALVLGLLVEAEYPLTGQLHRAVGAGMDRYLDLMRRTTTVEPPALALLYLLAHFPGDRDRILATVRHLNLDPGDWSRLDRSLQELDPDDPDLGRAWPSPWDWAISEEEREFDRQWIRGLTPEQVTKTWEGDTRSVRSYLGAKAHWALRNGMPTVVTDSSPYREVVRTDPPDLEAGAFGQHAGALRCPACHGRLDLERQPVRCRECAAAYRLRQGVLDLSQRLRAGAGLSDAQQDVEADVLQNAAVMRGIGFHYENGMRPSFLRVMGQNWSGLVTPADEDRYIADHADRPNGTVLDLAAGAGRWTAVLADAVGAERVLPLDLNDVMLLDLRTRLPVLPAVRASALDLPFADASLDAVNCWNALQALPDAAQAIAEVGRCLRPGGVLTMMTFRWADDPVYRYFQSSHHFPTRPDGFLLFTIDEIKSWLAGAGLAVRHEASPGTFVFITAQRKA